MPPDLTGFPPKVPLSGDKGTLERCGISRHTVPVSLWEDM